MAILGKSIHPSLPLNRTIRFTQVASACFLAAWVASGEEGPWWNQAGELPAANASIAAVIDAQVVAKLTDRRLDA